MNYVLYTSFVRCATSRTVPGSISGGITWDFFRGSFRQNHVPWGRLSLWKWVPGFSPGVKAAGAFGWRPTTLVVPKVEKIRGLNLPGTPWATSAFAGYLYFTFYTCFVLTIRTIILLSHRHISLATAYLWILSWNFFEFELCFGGLLSQTVISMCPFCK